MAYHGSAYILFRPFTESFTADTKEYYKCLWFHFWNEIATAHVFQVSKRWNDSASHDYGKYVKAFQKSIKYLLYIKILILCNIP